MTRTTDKKLTNAIATCKANGLKVTAPENGWRDLGFFCKK